MTNKPPLWAREPGSPALVVLRRHYGTHDRLVAIGIHTHPADRYAIVTQLQPGTAPGSVG